MSSEQGGLALEWEENRKDSNPRTVGRGSVRTAGHVGAVVSCTSKNPLQVFFHFLNRSLFVAKFSLD